MMGVQDFPGHFLEVVAKGIGGLEAGTLLLVLMVLPTVLLRKVLHKN
jgi:hypothetical protein